MSHRSQQNPNNPVDSTGDAPATIDEEPQRMTTRTKAAAGATSAALLVFGLMLAGQVSNPIFFRSPDPDPAVLAEVDAEFQAGMEAATATAPSQETPDGGAVAPDPADVADSDDVLIGQPGDDALLGTPGNDELVGTPDGDISGSADDVLVAAGHGGDPVPEVVPSVGDSDSDSDAAPPMPGLRTLCPSVLHGETSSDLWFQGTVDQLQDGWIVAGGPSINGGASMEIPVTDGAFNFPGLITAYADHELTRFELGWPDATAPIDLLPVLAAGPGTIFPVGPDEGSIFEKACFEFSPESPNLVDESVETRVDQTDTDATSTSTSTSAGEAATDLDEAMFEQQRLAEEADRIVNTFLASFVDDHRNGDVERLQATLHPSVRLAYGDDVCSDYIDRTAGSLTSAKVLGVGVPQPLDMNTPSGQISFPEAIPFTVEFEVVDGSTFINDAHLPIHDGEAQWLTTCGVEAP